MSAYGLLYDKILTRTDPEQAHHAAFAAIKAATPATGAVALVARRGFADVEGLGLKFRGHLGLAAGFDKNAGAVNGLAALGFSFVEVGTVTARPQPGNAKPRLARLTADRAVVNRMGFNNDGAEVVARRLAGRRFTVPLGINIGKSKVVPDDDARAVLEDYSFSTHLLAPHADYLVVNVSSPNTPGLRNLQSVERLEPLLREVRSTADDVTSRQVPLLVKIAPDLADDDVLAVADLVSALGLDGVVATNTTIAREGLRSRQEDVDAAGGGGLSGAPLKARADEVVRLLRGRLGFGPTIIGVGGIASTQDAIDRLSAGADLLQAYTAFIYEGPLWPGRVNRELGRAAREGKL